MKKVVIDARMITSGEMHGIARYVYQLLSCLRVMSLDIKIIALVNRGNPLLRYSWTKNIELMEINSHWISFQEQWELPKLLKHHNIDLLHSPSFIAPIHCPCKLIMTIHDLNHVVMSKFYTPIHQLYYKYFVRYCAYKSQYILTVSKFSKSEIIKNLNIDSNKIFVTYNGVSKHFKPVENVNYQKYVRDIYDLPHQFIFCLSNNKPHKNLHQLVRAYCYSDTEYPLVITSSSNEELIKIADTYGKKHLLFFSRFIEEQHLPAVYSMAKVFIYPSSYEGFGLPALEALACGTPVIVSKSSSLPEVVGNYANFIDPHNYQNIAQVLDTVIQNNIEKQQLITQKKLRIAHAKSFSWEHMSKETLKLYKKIIG